MKHFLLVAAATTAFAAGVAARSQPFPLSAAESESKGKELYSRVGCYECHGFAGQGSIMTGPSLAGKGLSTKQVFDFSRSPKGSMPPYRQSIISDVDLLEIAKYVAALPAGAKPEQIPELSRVLRATSALEETTAADRPPVSIAASAARGRVLYSQQCAACHGITGQGGIARALSSRGLSASFVKATILNPPSGMPKLSPKPLTASDVSDIATYVASTKTR